MIDDFSYASEELWWQEDDFNAFLQVRLKIEIAYRNVAKKLGVDLIKLSSVGPYAAEAYKRMVEEAPYLVHESRRGLELGRRRERAKIRDDYIQAVVKEQRRMRKAMFYIWSGLDVERLRQVAQKASAEDVLYAIKLANVYYEQDRWKEKVLEEESRGGATSSGLGQKCVSFGYLLSPNAAVQQSLASFNELPMAPASPRRTKYGDRVSSKGYGLSREALQEVGLGPNGKVLLQSTRRQVLRSAAIDDSESDIVAGESEEECRFELTGEKASPRRTLHHRNSI
jgi:hypothetical protein